MKLRKWIVALGMMSAVWGGCGADDTGVGGTTMNEATGLGVGRECAADRECRAGLACAEGACALAGTTALGSACAASGECVEGLYCDALTGLCASAGAQAAGTSCSAEADCAAGLRCVAQGLSGVCAASGAGDVGAECATGAECLAGLGCSPTGRCAAGAAALPVPFAGQKCERSAMESGPARVYFEVPEDPAAVDEFYRLPYPNDIRTKDGRPDLRGHATPGVGVVGFDVVKTYIDAISAGQVGFGLNHATFLRTSASPDFDTINANGDAPTLYMMNISPDSPGYNTKPVVSWQAVGGSGSDARYICRNWLAVRPVWGRPLAPATTYAAVMTTGVKAGAEGKALAQDEDFKAMLATSAPAAAHMKRAWDAYAPLRAWIADKGIDASTLAGAAVFTTGDPWALLRQLPQVVGASAPVASELVRCEAGAASPCDDGLTGEAHTRGCVGAAQAGFDEVQGQVALPIVQEGAAPYLNEGGAVKVVGDKPAVVRTEQVCMAMTVPKQAAPAEGWPVLIYAHGTGGDYRSQVDDVAALVSELTAADGGKTGMITIGWDQVQHASRRGDSQLDPEPLVFNYGNPAAARGNFIQGAADIHAIVAYVAALEIPADQSPTGAAIKADPSKIWLMGHSQGGTTAPLAAPFNDKIKGVILSGAGGGLTLALLDKSSPVSAKQGLQLALQDPGVGEAHPVLSLIQGYFEAVDPVNYGQYLGSAQIEGVTSPAHVLHIFGTGDSYTPPSGMKALARAMRMAYLNPILDMIEGGGVLLLDGMIKNNASAGGKRYTVAGRQYAPQGYDGHFVAFRDAKAREDIARFLVTGLLADAPVLGK
jgi:predicted esterase